MRLLDSLRFRIANLFRGSRLSAEMDEELRSHIQHRADDLERSGLPRDQAERRAPEFRQVLQFGKQPVVTSGPNNRTGQAFQTSYGPSTGRGSSAQRCF